MFDFDVELDALRNALEKATPGPWTIHIDDTGDRPVRVPSISAPDDLDCTIIHFDGFWQEYWQFERGNREMNDNAAAIVSLRNNAIPIIDALLVRLSESEERVEEAFRSAFEEGYNTAESTYRQCSLALNDAWANYKNNYSLLNKSSDPT